MFPIQEFEKRFREILDQLDDLREEAEGDQADAIDEMNADFEDALFVIESISAEDDDWQEAFSDALEEFKDLLEEYRRLSESQPELAEIANRLQMTIALAEGNLGA